jgi:isopentenyldiphosphate isomerase
MELLDLYDNNRLPLGKTVVRGDKQNDNENRLVIHICIFNSNGEMLIQKRKSTKKVYPGVWDLSVGGCVSAGETSADGASRELMEELGIDYNFKGVRPHFTVNFKNGFDDYYFLEMDLDLISFRLQQEEVEEIKWASKEEIVTLRKNNQFVPYFESFLTTLFDLRTQLGVIE